MVSRPTVAQRFLCQSNVTAECLLDELWTHIFRNVHCIACFLQPRLLDGRKRFPIFSRWPVHFLAYSEGAISLQQISTVLVQFADCVEKYAHLVMHFTRSKYVACALASESLIAISARDIRASSIQVPLWSHESREISNEQPHLSRLLSAFASRVDAMEPCQEPYGHSSTAPLCVCSST